MNRPGSHKGPRAPLMQHGLPNHDSRNPGNGRGVGLRNERKIPSSWRLIPQHPPLRNPPRPLVVRVDMRTPLPHKPTIRCTGATDAGVGHVSEWPTFTAELP